MRPSRPKAPAAPEPVGELLRELVRALARQQAEADYRARKAREEGQCAQ